MGSLSVKRDPLVDWLLIALLVVFTCGDVIRLGYYFDDFILLDAVRRMPLPGLLLGQFGIRPWYRPLSRELYFLLGAAAGPAGLIVARTLSLLCLVFLLRGVQRLGGMLFGSRTGAAACVVFAGYSVAKFLAGWASSAYRGVRIWTP